MVIKMTEEMCDCKYPTPIIVDWVEHTRTCTKCHKRKMFLENGLKQNNWLIDNVKE